MGEIADLLERRGYRLDEAELARALEDLLPERNSTASLSDSDRTWLVARAGVGPATEAERRGLRARRLVTISAEVAQALSRSEVAELLGLDASRVSHRAAERRLYTIRVGPAKLAYPDWQFSGGGVLPHLAEVLAEIDPVTLPPLVRSFMSTPDPDLVLGSRPVSPMDWLLAGGDPAAVVELAGTLGDQV